MLYKVWAQNCVRPKGMRIVEATQEDLNEVFDKIYNLASESNLIDDSLDEDENEIEHTKVEKYYGMIKDYWEKNKSISAGDYMIVDVEDKNDIQIPNACYGDESFIF